MNRTEREHSLRAVLNTLEDYLDDLVLIGGWVPYLHLRYGPAANEAANTSLTVEADLLVPDTLERGGRLSIPEILEESGFRPLGESRVVWARAPEAGETIEFFQLHRGPADSRGIPTPVSGQPGLEAITLDHLWVLREFTEVLVLPPHEERDASLDIRVPRLGAFVLNKTNTFGLRGGDDRPVRAGKDLLYLRDVMAAGDRVQEFLEDDLRSMLDSSRNRPDRLARYLDRGRFHVQKVAPDFHEAAAEILMEREGLSAADARAEIEGYLRDLVDIIDSVEEEPRESE